MDSERPAGFSTKVQVQARTKSGTYYRLQVPVNTVESLDLEKGMLVELDVRESGGKIETVRRKLQAASNQQLRIDLPKNFSNKLELESGELVDCWIKKV